MFQDICKNKNKKLLLISQHVLSCWVSCSISHLREVGWVQHWPSQTCWLASGMCRCPVGSIMEVLLHLSPGVGVFLFFQVAPVICVFQTILSPTVMPATRKAISRPRSPYIHKYCMPLPTDGWETVMWCVFPLY